MISLAMQTVGVHDSSGGFAQRGYALLEGFFPRAKLVALRGEVDAALVVPMEGCERPHNRLAPLRWSDPVVNLMLAQRLRRQRIARCWGR